MQRPYLNKRIATVAAHDIVMAALSFELAIWIRYYTYGAPQSFGFLWDGTLLFAAVAAVVFWAMGLYRGIWHYASLSDLIAIIKAVSLALLVFLPVLFVATRLENFPRSAIFIQWPILVFLLAGPRLLYRYYKDGNLAALRQSPADARVPVLLAGAGDRAEMFIREMTRSPRAAYRVVGIVDDKPQRIGRDIRGVRVLGDLSSIDEVVGRLAKSGRAPQRLIIASNRYDGATVGRVLEAADRLGLKLSRMPRLTDFAGDAGAARLDPRPIDVEDLLGRPQQVLDRDAMRRLIGGRRVLITGAGGTIGSELARQIAAFTPARLALLENSEHALYRIDLELGERAPDLDRSPILGDVRDPRRLSVVFERERPDLVFHAAAFKHVPMVEANPNEGVLTNVLGTANVAEACRDAGVAAMVMISTDKAVNPSSVMGATKRVAEMVCQGLSLGGGGTRYVTVRFGNVLGSTGSVVPLFQRQLAAGGPITVTDPDVSRYFMTTREAVELVLQASAMAPDGDEAGKIHVLDMGQPVRIRDLAQQMVRLAGLKAGKDIDIVFTGLRPGEKLTEELFHAGEAPAPTGAPGILLAAPRVIDYDLLRPQIDELAAAAAARRTDETLALIGHLVPEYQGASPPSARAGAARR